MSDFVSALERRHSQYAITETSKVSDADLVETIKRITLSVPSAFNSQSQRVVVLFGADHARLWNIVKEALRDVAADEEAFAKTQAKIDAFAAGHGTVLFFDDTAVTTDLGVRFPCTPSISPRMPSSPTVCCNWRSGLRCQSAGWAPRCNITIR